MIQAAHCQFCSKELLLQIDDDYAAIGDSLGLLKLATCDRCTRLAESKRDLRNKIQRTAAGLLWMRASGITEEQTEKIRAILGHMIRKWISLSAEWRQSVTEATFDPVMIEQIMEAPADVNYILRKIWGIK